MPDPYIRVAQLGDDPDLRLLDRLTWSPLHAVTPEPQPPYPPFFSGRHAPDDTLVAELEGRVVGYVRIAFPTPLAANAHVRQIQGLAVHDDVRGRGVGRALIRAAVAEARHRGARRLTLRVLGHNTPARRLYASEGFVVEGVLPEEFFLQGRYVDDVLMGRPL
ncbi:GNAT family N-acetyltransferase [Streptomyces sp. TG1A-8]|uniref:GNAT family N-acetyltransferase n=1 Tax=Streptomyces sp. TG1A-8 TaxID=3051385 RepID=UPI00265C49FA|nr:GNAT family N-acetyltransferase [Streptomyces sp. TG1A-8]MDO0928026.1 GNAT family N-acetyltransferase [Streptomyces sp. TG1A-8]